jgi:hypothetical protein
MWGEHIEGDPREILADAEGDEKAQGADGSPGQLSAQAWLSAALAGGERKQTDIAAECAEQGFSSAKIFRSVADAAGRQAQREVRRRVVLAAPLSRPRTRAYSLA